MKNRIVGFTFALAVLVTGGVLAQQAVYGPDVVGAKSLGRPVQIGALNYDGGVTPVRATGEGAVQVSVVGGTAPTPSGSQRVEGQDGGYPQSVTTTGFLGACVTTEVLVLTGSDGGTLLPPSPLATRRTVEVQNLGPNPLSCVLNGVPVLTKSRRINADPTAPWSADAPTSNAIRCLSATADQVTGAATIITECP